MVDFSDFNDTELGIIEEAFDYYHSAVAMDACCSDEYFTVVDMVKTKLYTLIEDYRHRNDNHNG